MILLIDFFVILSSLLVPSYTQDGELVSFADKFTNVVWILVDQKSNTLSVRNPKGLIGYLSNDKKYKLYKAGLGRS